MTQQRVPIENRGLMKRSSFCAALLCLILASVAGTQTADSAALRPADVIDPLDDHRISLLRHRRRSIPPIALFRLV